MKKILLNNLSATPLNPRRIFNERALCESLLSNGLDVPLQVHQNAKGNKFEVLRGERRLRALRILEKEFPTKFKEIFGEGITCEVHANLSDIEKINIVNDHGSLLPLSNQFEIYLTCKGYFRMQYSEAKTLSHIQTMLDSVVPLTGKAFLEVKELRDQLDRSNVQTREKRAEDYQKRYFLARRGIMQRYKHIYDCPSIIEDCMEYKWLGELPAGYSKGDLPTLSDVDVTALLKVFRSETTELGSDEKGRPRSSKSNPQAKFLEAFEAIKARKTSKKVKVQSVLSKQKILTPCENGEISSGTLANLLKYHAGDNSLTVNAVYKADSYLEVVELLLEHDAKLWATCCDRAKEIKQVLREELAKVN